jgi:hypothetical protein
VEHGAAEEADDRGGEEDHDGPSGYLVGVGSVFVELYDLEVFGIDLLLQLLHILL